MVFPNEVVALPDPAVASDLVDGPTFQDKLVAQVGPYKPVVEALQAHGLTLPTRTLAKTGAYTMAPGDGTVLADATGGAFNVTLPPHLNGRLVRVEKVDASGNAVTVLPGSGTVGGAANDPLEARWHGATYQSDGTNWTVVARAVPRGTYVGTTALSVAPAPSGDVTGATDSAAIAAWLATLPATGRSHLWIPGDYYVNATVALDGAKTQHHIMYGVRIRTVGAIWGMTVTGHGAGENHVEVEGALVYQRSSATALGGFLGQGTYRLHLRNTHVIADGTNASYVAAYQLQNTTAADDNSGCLFTTLENVSCAKYSGGDTGNIKVGIRILGASNATRIINGDLGNTTDGVVLTAQSGGTGYIANDVKVNGVAFETFTNGVVIDGDGAGNGVGLIVNNCRAEAGTTFFVVRNRTIDFAQPPIIGPHNFVSPDITSYASVPAGIRFIGMDPGRGRSPVDLMGIIAVPNRWHTSTATAIGVAALTSSRLNYLLVSISQAMNLASLAVEVTTAGAGGSTVRLGVFRDTREGLPGALVVDGGTVATDTTGVKIVGGSSTLIEAGRYWLGCVSQGGTPATVRVVTQQPGLGIATVSSIAASGYYEDGVPGALPAVATPITDADLDATPRVMFQATAIAL